MPAHLTKPNKNFDYSWHYINRACRRNIQDRYHMSEIVYALCRNDEPGISPETYRWIDGHLRAMGAYTVVLTTDYERFESLWTDEREEMYDKEFCWNVNTSFECIVEDCFHGYHPDWDHCVRLTKDRPFVDDEDVDKIVEQYLRRYDRVSSILANRWTNS